MAKSRREVFFWRSFRAVCHRHWSQHDLSPCCERQSVFKYLKFLPLQYLPLMWSDAYIFEECYLKCLHAYLNYMRSTSWHISEIFMLSMISAELPPPHIIYQIKTDIIPLTVFLLVQTPIIYIPLLHFLFVQCKLNFRKALTWSIWFSVWWRKRWRPLATRGAVAFGSLLVSAFLWGSVGNNRSLHKPNSLTSTWCF